MIEIPKDLEFEGTGHRGAAFEQKGQSERNLQTMLEALSNKQAQKAVESLSKIKEDQWKGINENLTILGGFMDTSAGSVLNVFKDTLVQTISLKFAEVLANINKELYAI